MSGQPAPRHCTVSPVPAVSRPARWRPGKIARNDSPPGCRSRTLEGPPAFQNDQRGQPYARAKRTWPIWRHVGVSSVTHMLATPVVIIAEKRRLSNPTFSRRSSRPTPSLQRLEPAARGGQNKPEKMFSLCVFHVGPFAACATSPTRGKAGESLHHARHPRVVAALSRGSRRGPFTALR